MSKPDVLIVTYYWPPSGGAGVQRFLKFAKYLPQCGFHPLVLTVENPTYPIVDKSLEADVPDEVKVYRTRTYEVFDIYAWLKGKEKGEVTKPTMDLKEGGTSLIGGWIRANILLPDARRGWTLTAKTKAVELIRKFDIPNIITTGPPHSTHFIGKYVQKKTGVHWVADFRDPWSEVYYNQLMPRTSWAQAIDRHMEYGVLSRADEVVVISPSMVDLEKRILDREYRVIPNGFDPDDYPTEEELRAMAREVEEAAEEDPDSETTEGDEEAVSRKTRGEHKPMETWNSRGSRGSFSGYHEPTWRSEQEAGGTRRDMPGKYHKTADLADETESEKSSERFNPREELKGRSLMIRFIGSVREAALPDDLLTAIADLPKSLREELTVEFIGNAHPRLAEIIKELELEEHVHLRGYMPHRQAVKAMIEADLLLLSISRTSGAGLILTGKLFEYLGSGKPILFLGDTEGDAAKIILENEQGVTIAHDNVEEIRKFLSAALRHPSGLSAYTPGAIDRTEHPYSRLSLTKKLAELLVDRQEDPLDLDRSNEIIEEEDDAEPSLSDESENSEESS